MANVPGTSYCVIEDGKVLRAVVSGLIEVGKPEAITPDTPFLACSVSKTVAAMTTLTLVRQGRVELDADINRYLHSWR